MTAVASGLGTILLGHGRNPLTLDYWVLNMEANNKDPDKQSEAAIRGSVVENRLTIVHAASGAKTFVPLDGNPIDPSRSLGMPTSLDFIPLGEFQQGFAWVVGALSDRALLLDPQGNLSRRVDLPEGSIPRAVLFDALNDRVLFYCFGTNEVRVHAQLNPAQVLASLSLGHDPAPASVREGRKIFYDASHSASDNASCASCHIDGRTDMVAWNLSNLPKDDKGPLVTQSLAGIEHLLPLHWRGEQKNGLIDFNAAFPNLLGGKPLDTTPGGEFDQFQDFVFSINSPANPNQSPERLLDQAYSPSHHTGAPGNPVEGQTIWFDLPRVAMLTCNQCHQMPTGTNNDTSTDGRGQAIEQARMKVAGFNELWRKAQPEVLVEFNPAEPPPNEQQLYPLLGTGLAHAGTVNTLFGFADLVLVDSEARAVEAFLHQMDSGIAPLVHQGRFLDAGTVSSAGRYIQERLLPQAHQGHVDVAAFGTVTLGGRERELRWFYDAQARFFHAEDSSVAPRTLDFFLGQAFTGQASNVFLGLPVGMAERFAVDFDEDDLRNGDELVLGTDPFEVDSDGDGFWDGHEAKNGGDPADDQVFPSDSAAPAISAFQLNWVTTRQAKLSWRTDEPTTYSLSYDTALHQGTKIGSRFTKVHSAVLSDLLPGTNDEDQDPVLSISYSVSLTSTDLAGNQAFLDLPAPMTTSPFVELIPVESQGPPKVLGEPFTLFTEGLAWAGPPLIDVQSGTFQATAQARIVYKINRPPAVPAPNVVLIARVMILREGEQVPEVSTSFTTSGPTSITVQGEPPEWTEPLLLSSISDSDGEIFFSFSQGGLSSLDTVILNVEAGGSTPANYDPGRPGVKPDFDDISRWSFVDTPGDVRELSFTFP